MTEKILRNIKITMEYDGTQYCGFQAQLKQGTPTIQEVLERALAKLTAEKIKIHSAGRTDKGVHAYGQVAHFLTSTIIPIERMVFAINQKLPDDIVIQKAEEVPLAFHARKSALGKHYQYRIYNSRTATAFGNQYCYWVPYQLDQSLIEQGCRMLEGTHNFRSFSATGSSVKTYTRTIYQIRLTVDGPWWSFDFYGNGFLYNMVRIIVGTLLDIGSGRRDIDTLNIALQGQDRKLAGKTAPPHGLYLKSVFYP